MNARAGILFVFIVTAGCVNPEYVSERLADAAVLIHNMWLEIRSDHVSLRASFVNPADHRLDFLSLNSGIGNTSSGLWLADLSPPRDVREGLDAGTYREERLPHERPPPGSVVAFGISAAGPDGFDHRTSYDGPCVAVGAGGVTRLPAATSGECDEVYDVNGMTFRFVDCTWCLGGVYRVPLIPTDEFFVQWVWDCCRLRSLPAYDAVESAVVPDLPTREPAQIERAFPIEAGARNATIAAHVFPSESLVPSSVALVVENPSGGIVARAAGDAASPAEIFLEDLSQFPDPSVLRAHVEATGAPGTRVELEIHVNDGVHPPQRPP